MEFFFNPPERKNELRQLLASIPKIGEILNKHEIIRDDIIKELEICNEAINKIDEFKHRLYYALYYNW